MQTAKWFLQLSRPRFWFYLFGPFLVGFAAGYNRLDFSLVEVSTLLLAGLFFTLPANLLIYGVNDLFDYETDKNNPKKKQYETLIAPKNRGKFTQVLTVSTVPFIVAIIARLLADGNMIALYSFIAFLFFGIGYSAPPIRAKTKPFLDSFFNILYIFPGFVAYAILGGGWPSWQVILASTAWVMAMHAFSAIPDIKSDKKASLRTIATILGQKRTILFCAFLYITSAALTFGYLRGFSVMAGAVYATLMFAAYVAHKDKDIFAVYKTFPYVNVITGAFLFLMAMIS
jgi:4-hydroxybenzoate polyprenyltransferase